MNHIDDQQDDWGGLMESWQSQVIASPDLEALQREVARRSRRLRLLRIGELLVAALALGNCLHAMLLKTKPIPSWALLSLTLLVASYTLWVQWQRRRQWRARDLDPRALVAFEVARTRTSIRIWRVSTWLSAGVWVALTLWGIVAMRTQPRPDAISAQMWLLNIVVNAVVLLASAGWGFWMGQRRRRRLLRLDALRDALSAE